MGRKQNTNLKIILDRSLAVLIDHDGPKGDIVVYCLGFSRFSMIFPGLSEHTNLHYHLTDFMNRSGPTLINAMLTLFLEHTSLSTQIRIR